MSYTDVHPSSKHAAHAIDLFCFLGAPENNDQQHPVEVLVNTGFVVGFCPTRYQPSWVAYRIAHADRDVDFDRPHLYYADTRISPEFRLSNATFGTHDGVQYHVGHMAPNEAINRQFGRRAQMETFFMTNMSPQRGSLNSGVWRSLEKSILEIENTGGNDHVWALIGPVFGDDPDVIERDKGKRVPIPESYFCITVDPRRWPYDRMSNVDVLALLIPQDASGGSPLDYQSSVSEIESLTSLSFFPGWAPSHFESERAASTRSLTTAPSSHRLVRAIQRRQSMELAGDI